MHVVHVDQNGEPDQGFANVLVVVLSIQAVIAMVVLGILMAGGVVPAI